MICPVCGGGHPPVGSSVGTVPAFACPGPKVSWSGVREMRDVELVSWGLDPAHPGYANLTEPPTRKTP